MPCNSVLFCLLAKCPHILTDNKKPTEAVIPRVENIVSGRHISGVHRLNIFLSMAPTDFHRNLKLTFRNNLQSDVPRHMFLHIVSIYGLALEFGCTAL